MCSRSKKKRRHLREKMITPLLKERVALIAVNEKSHREMYERILQQEHPELVLMPVQDSGMTSMLESLFSGPMSPEEAASLIRHEVNFQANSLPLHPIIDESGSMNSKLLRRK